MTWIDWIVCAVVECAQREAAECFGLHLTSVAFRDAQYDWYFSKERERWLRRQ